MRKFKNAYLWRTYEVPKILSKHGVKDDAAYWGVNEIIISALGKNPVIEGIVEKNNQFKEIDMSSIKKRAKEGKNTIIDLFILIRKLRDLKQFKWNLTSPDTILEYLDDRISNFVGLYKEKEIDFLKTLREDRKKELILFKDAREAEKFLKKRSQNWKTGFKTNFAIRRLAFDLCEYLNEFVPKKRKKKKGRAQALAINTKVSEIVSEIMNIQFNFLEDFTEPFTKASINKLWAEFPV